MLLWNGNENMDKKNKADIKC